jgi:hypothetical protein
LAVAFEIAPPDEQTLTESIYRQRALAWQDAMTGYARQAGSKATGQGPFEGDRQYLLDVSRDDAASIRSTFNRELSNEIARLYAANPDGDRQYYITNLTTWADRRADYKDRQIALMNQKTARHYAQQRFKDMNKVQAQYRFSGPAPVCDDCAAQFAAGVVGQKHVDDNSAPLHPNCPHEWAMVEPKLGVSEGKIWVGAAQAA